MSTHGDPSTQLGGDPGSEGDTILPRITVSPLTIRLPPPGSGSCPSRNQSPRRSALSASKRPARDPSPDPPSSPAVSTSLAAPDRHASSTKTKVPPSYKLSFIPKLIGTENYQLWRDISLYILKLFNCWDIVIGDETIEIKYDEDYGADDYTNFQDRYQYTAMYLIQTVDPKFLILLAMQEFPHKIRTTPVAEFARENIRSFFDQLNCIQIPSKIVRNLYPNTVIPSILNGIDYNSAAQ